MKKNDVINGYILLQDFTTAGGGQCQWSFAQKGEKQYFIKEYLSPTYPVDGSPGSLLTKERKLKHCEKFESYHKKLQSVFSGKCGEGSNLIVTRDFFRYKTKYYKTTDKVDVSSMTISDISKLPLPEIMIILKTITHSLQMLHHENIVHGDLKPDNILIKETKRSKYTAKLIDFDNCYFSGNPFEVFDEIVGDMTYYSPELALFFTRDESIKTDMLQTKSDIFSLGIIFYQYLTGILPFISKKNKFPYAAVLNNDELVFPTGIPENIKTLLKKMLVKDFKKRPNITEVFSELRAIRLDSDDTKSRDSTPKIRAKNFEELLGTVKESKIGEVKESVKPTLRGKNLDKLLNVSKKDAK
ncbi:MAG: protein kinase [Prevotella sp.]|jgi:serine/threonine protein kinase|nr:protein kinase [Prevotella sp.]